MDDLEGVPVGYEEMDDEALNIKFRKLCHDIVRERVRNFIRQHQSSSYTHKKSISFTVKYLYSIQYTWLSTEQFIIMPCSNNSNCDVVRGPH